VVVYAALLEVVGGVDVIYQSLSITPRNKISTAPFSFAFWVFGFGLAYRRLGDKASFLCQCLTFWLGDFCGWFALEVDGRRAV